MSRATAVTLVFMTQYSYSVSTCIGLSVCGTRHTLFVAHVCQRKGCTFFDASRSALSSSLVAMHTGCVAREIRFATWRACKPPLDGTRSAPAQSAAASRRTAATRQRIAIGAESAGIAKYSCTDQSPVRSSQGCLGGALLFSGSRASAWSRVGSVGVSSRVATGTVT